MSDIAELLARVPFLAALSAADRQSLAKVAGRRTFARGQEIFHKDEPGDALFIIEEGSVRIYMPSPQGTDLTLAVLGAGEFFGDIAILDGGPRSASAAALQETKVVALEREDFRSALSSMPKSAMAVLAAVAQRLRETDEMAADLAFLDVGGRVAKKLLELAAEHGVRTSDGVRIELGLTQEGLANMVGVTRESVNRHVSELRRRGVLSREGRRFVIRDAEALRRYIGGG